MFTGTNDTQTDTSSINNLHNIPGSIAEPVVQAVKRTATGQFAPGVSGNLKGGPRKETSILRLLRDKLDQPCDYCRELTWAEAIVKRELEQGLNDPVARKHLLDRLLGRATESINLAQSGVVTLRVVHDDYVNPNEIKQISESTEVDNNENNSAPLDTKE